MYLLCPWEGIRQGEKGSEGRGRKEREVKARNAGHVKQFRGKGREQEVAVGHVWGLNRSGKVSVKIFRKYIKEKQGSE